MAVVWAQALGGLDFNLYADVSVCIGPHRRIYVYGWRLPVAAGLGVGSRDGDGEQGAHPAASPSPLPLLLQHHRAGLALPRSLPVSEKLSNESRSAKSDSPLAKGCNLLLAGLKKKKKKVIR